jgi:hypothetical protein
MGRVWLLNEMTDQHLRNVHAMLKRSESKWWANERAASSYMGGGEMASYEADRAAQTATDNALELGVMARAILCELNRRNKTI